MGLLNFLPIVGQAVDAISTGISNRAQRKYATKMYDRQRADALTDQKFQNEYNSPAAQMERLKAGGLNPNLVYGGGATTTGATVRASSADGYKPEPLTKNTGQAIQNSLFNGYDLKMKQAQLDQIAEVTKVAQEEQLLKQAQQKQVASQTDWNNFNINKGNAMLNPTLEGQKLKNSKMLADTAYTIDQNERAALLNSQSLQKGVIEMANLRLQGGQTGAQIDLIRQNTKNASIQNDLLRLDQKMKEVGMTYSDPWYLRLGKEASQKLGIMSPKEFKGWVDGKISEMGSYLKKGFLKMSH